ncbi:rhodanese-like domain-containing protein [Desulfotalea psychrophila]|uniref:Related to thiosulfate sulfurtransferase n=1 Tax=Desulfotalea psychrophila (strain LSv54 / DSM 12343) TaxID=177439 RepID=Q6ALC9_DESPS|nr:rhodanese-like domain-containing protein [Desulfotalea psychrophila]CAG36846.1 related to thiosulfate sulfurtransferase [Desulfotalea psychrophila LSv54]
MKKIATMVLLLSIFTFAGQSRAELKMLDSQEIIAIQNNPDWLIVDTRLSDAFNGWKLDGVERGGHIEGAVNFSANWLHLKKKNLKEELLEILKAKGISPDRHIVLYDANGLDAKAVAGFLREENYSRLYGYDIRGWAADTNLAMQRYKNYQRIVPAVIVRAALAGKSPETFTGSKKIKVVEASWGEEKTSYSKGHIPGAFHVNTDRIEPPTTSEPVMWLLADSPTLKRFALEFGFQKDDTIIVASQEPMAAYRLATVLRYIGVDDVRVLNGGTDSWLLAGYPLETESHSPRPVTDFAGIVPGNSDIMDSMSETKAGLDRAQGFTLVDNRTWQEHIGETSGYSYHKKRGRIPGAIFGYAGTSGAYGLEYYRNPDKTMRSADEFLALWQEQGINTNNHLSFMCGSGWRAAEIYYYADVYGLRDIAIFSDGWIGWSNDEKNLTETGIPTR